MKLQELVKKYKGTARFDVNAIVNDNVEDVIVFHNTEVDALKESILNADVVRFMVSEIVSGVPTIKADVRETTPSNSGDPGGGGTTGSEVQEAVG